MSNQNLSKPKTIPRMADIQEDFKSAVRAELERVGMRFELFPAHVKIIWSNSRLMRRDDGAYQFMNNPHVGGANMDQLADTITKMYGGVKK